MEIHTFELGAFMVSAYVVIDGGETMIVDAPEGSKRIIAFCERRGLAPRLLVNTHGHGDHIFANTLLKNRWPAMAIAVGKGDLAMLSDPELNLSAMFGVPVESNVPERVLEGGDRIEIGKAVFEVIATPGHTPGGISLFSRDGPDGRPVVFAGDALFAGGIGRTDFPGSSHETLIASIRDRLLTLPPETVVYPGHGPATTIGREAQGNPWL